MPLTFTKFEAAWCAPCKLLKPHWDRYTSEHKGQALYKVVDIDTEPLVARAANIQSVPTIIVAQDGKELGRIHGVPKTYAALKKALDSYLSTP